MRKNTAGQDRLSRRVSRLPLVGFAAFATVVAIAISGCTPSGDTEGGTEAPATTAQVTSTTLDPRHPVVTSATPAVRPGEMVTVPITAGGSPVHDLNRVTDAGANVTVEASGGAVMVIASRTAEPGEVSLRMSTVGCVADECDREVVVDVTLTVEPYPDAAEAATPLTTPDPTRIDETATEGVYEVVDEVIVLAAASFDPVATADELGVSFVGGIPKARIWQFTVNDPARLALVESGFRAIPGVEAVLGHYIGVIDLNDAAYPGDWADLGSEEKWHFEMIGAPELWLDARWADDVKVGIVDYGLWQYHEDLNVASKVGLCEGDGCNRNPTDFPHGTHVAGLACADDQGVGLVGMAWGCPVYAFDLALSGDLHLVDRDGEPLIAFSMLVFTQAMIEVVDQGADVVNISMGWPKRVPDDDDGSSKCFLPTDQNRVDADEYEVLMSQGIEYATETRDAQGRPDVVWIVAAGNGCYDAQAQVPARLSLSHSNVVTVASVDSDGHLSPFSNWGSAVTVAAPGGNQVAGDFAGVWSSTHTNCDPAGCESTYGPLSGTSMAAPIVTGLAALMRQGAPDLPASELAVCLTAGSSPVTERNPSADRIPHQDPDLRGITLVNAPAAYACATAPKDFSWSIAGIEGLPWGTDRASAIEFASRYFGDPGWFYDTTPDVGEWCSTAEKDVLWANGPRLIFDADDRLVGIEPNDTASIDGIYELIGLSEAESIFGVGRRTEDPLFGWPMWVHEARDHGTVLSGFVFPPEDPPSIPYELVAVRVSVPGHEPSCPPVGT